MLTEQLNKSGLSERDITTIFSIFNKYPVIKLVYIFGSRALGTFKKGSDIDLAIMGRDVPENIIAVLQSEFEDSSLPYRVDLISYSSLEHIDLREHIKEKGIEFYTRKINGG